MTEAELQAALMDAAASRGLLAHHCGDSRLCQGAPGFPDTVMAGNGRVLFAEVKSTAGLATPDQETWLRALFGGGRTIGVVRPEHWRSGEVARSLDELARG